MSVLAFLQNEDVTLWALGDGGLNESHLDVSGGEERECRARGAQDGETRKPGQDASRL
jgi:hypothetical protein